VRGGFRGQQRGHSAGATACRTRLSYLAPRIFSALPFGSIAFSPIKSSYTGLESGMHGVEQRQFDKLRDLREEDENAKNFYVLRVRNHFLSDGVCRDIYGQAH
jgi:hypothetical protein